MFETHRASTAEANLDQILHRLRANPRVDGLMLAGSAGGRTPDSDIDLVLLVTDESVPRRYACTWVERCFTDLVFLATSEVDAIRSGAVPESLAADDGVRRWMLGALQDARILFDRSGRLSAARVVLAERCLAPVGPLWPEYEVSRTDGLWESLIAVQE